MNAADLQLLLHMSMRYAMGRRTYMPGMIQDLIKQHQGVFTNENLRQLADEITSQARIPGGLGADIDEKGWLEFRDWLLATADSGVIFPVPVPKAPDQENNKG